MTLPAIVMPASLPQWLQPGYESEPEAVYAHAAMATGHARTRRRWTSADRFEKASMRLDSDQLADFHTWHESTLQAGLLPFSAPFANYGPGLRWFDTLILEYVTVPRAGGRTLVNASLLLRGDPQLTGPA
jgi:hypothetical protein